MSPAFEKPGHKRQHLFLILGGVVAVALGGYGLYWYFVGSHYVSTDDAYVKAEVAQVTPAISGTVKQVLVVDTQEVAAGSPLVVIDEIDTKLALDKANANVAAAEAELTRTAVDLKRRQALANSGAVSAEELTNAQNAYVTAQAQMQVAQSAQNLAAVDLSRTVITAPVAGVVAKKQVEVGQHVQPGSPLLSVVPLQSVYVDANFKEVQLKKVKPGQPVELKSDLYGSSVVYHGKVAGLAGGTGSAFAIIPAQNATGNWIKVVQRLPVRVELNAEELQKHPLQVGLSMEATIDISK